MSSNGNGTTRDGMFVGEDLVSLAAICGVGALLNIFAAARIRNYFDTRKRTIFFLMYLDTLTATASNAAGVVIAAWLAVSNDEVVCSAMFLNFMGMNVCGIILTAELTVIR